MENEKLKKTKLFMLFGIVAMVASTLFILFFLFFYGGDISAKRKENKLIFGATYMTMNNPYYQILDTRIRAAIESRGGILITRDAAMDQERQNAEVKDLIASGAKVILLTPVMWDASEEALKIAAEAHVPVVVVDALVKNKELAFCSVRSDNYQAGALCAKHITAYSGRQRIQGFLDEIEGHENFKVVASGESDGQIENAMPVMEELLKKTPEADTVMALNDPSALGALAAISGMNFEKPFLVYGVDGSPEGKTMVNDNFMTATCAQFLYELAEKAVEQAYLAVSSTNGQAPSAQGRELIIPVALVTKENVNEYGTEGWQ